MTPTQIKICGVTNVNDARMCAELGADMIGFNFYPQSPRYIEPKVARRIIETLPSHADAVGIFVNGDADEIRNTANAAGVRCVQLHGDFSPDVGRELAREFRVPIVMCSSTHIIPIFAVALARRAIGLLRGQSCDFLDFSFSPVV